MRKSFVLSMIMIGIVTGGLFVAGCSGKNDISGTWKGKITLAATGNSLSDLEFSLKQNGHEVTGTMIFTKPGAKLPLTGTIKKGALSLSSPKKNGLSVVLTGNLDARGQIKGEALLEYDTPQLGKKQDRTVLEMTR